MKKKASLLALCLILCLIFETLSYGESGPSISGPVGVIIGDHKLNIESLAAIREVLIKNPAEPPIRIKLEPPKLLAKPEKPQKKDFKKDGVLLKEEYNQAKEVYKQARHEYEKNIFEWEQYGEELLKAKRFEDIINNHCRDTEVIKKVGGTSFEFWWVATCLHGKFYGLGNQLFYLDFPYEGIGIKWFPSEKQALVYAFWRDHDIMKFHVIGIDSKGNSFQFESYSPESLDVYLSHQLSLTLNVKIRTDLATFFNYRKLPRDTIEQSVIRPNE